MIIILTVKDLNPSSVGKVLEDINIHSFSVWQDTVNRASTITYVDEHGRTKSLKQR